MSKIKISENQFLGNQELNRLQGYFTVDGYKLLAKQMVFSYGVAKIASDLTFENLKIVPGTGVGLLTLKSGIAIDSNLDFIRNRADAIDVITSPNDNTLRYLKIKYKYTHIEDGTFDIAINGQLTGTLTKALEVLRGDKNHPVKIKFPNSAVNTLEYTVLSVNSDTNVTIQGASFVVELGQAYQVVGTFDTSVVPTPNKNIYEIDSYELVLDTTPPLFDDLEFILAEVITSGGVTTIVDRREENLFVLASGSDGLEISPSTNPLVGAEWVKFNGAKASKDRNLIKVGWGFKVNQGNWSLNTTTNKITIVTGSGGIWDDNTLFTNGDFDGWRVYVKSNGQYAEVKTSSRPISDIELILESNSGVTTSSDIVVVPTGDFIEFKVVNVISPTGDGRYSFPMALGEGIFDLVAGTSSNVQYRNIFRDKSTSFVNIEDGDYLNETSFDDDGVLIGSAVTIYSGGAILPVLSVDNFDDTKADKDVANVFLENNTFEKGIGYAYAGLADIALTPLPDANPMIDLAISNDGNFYKLTDTTGEGEIHFIKSNNLGTAIKITLEVRANIIIKHNLVPTVAETSAGFKSVYNQGGVDINLFTGDFITLVRYTDIWNVVGVWRKDGALDSSQANLFQIVGLDPKCFSFINVELGTILQEIITSICNLSTGNQYAFKAINTMVQDLLNADIIGTPDILLFQNDIVSPYFDNGNDMYVNRYIVPADGIRQKFIAENLYLVQTAGNMDALYEFGIYVKPVAGSPALAAGTNNGLQINPTVGVLPRNITMPSISTDYLTLNEGDEVFVSVKKISGSAGSVVESTIGMTFSNSF